jgi:plastocyanin
MRSWLARGGSVGALLVLIGCGGGSDGGAPAGPSPPPGGASATVSIVGQRGARSFTPNPANVVQGRTVAWRNTDTVVHRIVSNDGVLDTGDLAPGATSSALTLSTDGTNYHCLIHPAMVGAVNGSGGAPPPCQGIYC